MTDTKTSSAGAFDCIRLAAAIAVIFGHSYALTGHGAEEPVTWLTSNRVSVSEIAVYIFFAISGYLVTQSWLRDPCVKRFMLRRILRIIPALVLVITASALCVGAFLTRLDPASYFSARATWTYLAKILIYPAQYGLPGVFDTNPVPSVINGSLWTLRLEFTLYLIVAGLGSMGFLRWRWLCIGMGLICVAAYAVLSHGMTLGTTLASWHQTVILFANASPFFMGAGLAQFDLHSRSLWASAGVSALAALALITTPYFPVLLLLSLPIVTLLIAKHGHCDLGRFGDYSYGTYLWGFVVQQIIVFEYPGILPFKLFLIATPLTLILGVLSWHVVEKPALGLKPRKQATMGTQCF